MPFMRLAARSRIGLLDVDTLSMLEAGNVGDPQQMQRLLGHAPRAPDAFISPDRADVMARTALLGWLLPLLRVSLALVWLWSGITSFGLYPREESYQMLAAAAVPPSLQPLFLFGAATLDITLGLATLLWPRRLLWLGQIVLIVLYTTVISVALASLWLHPFGPVLKNLPMLALLLLLYYLEPHGARR
jgi:uncharacterized membrane protein YphA (DoxX/SURF4 family)